MANKSGEERDLESNRQFPNRQTFTKRTFERNTHNNNSKNLNNSFSTNVNSNSYYRNDYDDEGASLSSSPASSSTKSASSTTTIHNHDDGAEKNLFSGQSTAAASTTKHYLKDHHKKRSNRVTFASVLWKKFRKVGIKVMQVSTFLLVINFLIYYWPIESPEIEPKISAHKPRPKFVGPLAVNDILDSSDTLFSGQFHAPESMAWKKDKRSFYTGVEGGFILFVEPYKERWQIVAKLNAKNSIYDLSDGVQLVLPDLTVQLNNNRLLYSSSDEVSNQEIANSNSSTSTATTAARLVENVQKASSFVNFCKRDVELYGKRAEFEPQLVSLSRCSRPLGLRLSPDETYLYVNDAISGLYRVDLTDATSTSATTTSKKKGFKLNQVTKLIDYTSSLEKKYTGSELDDQRLLFTDDIAVDWGASKNGGDVVYMTDCSKRWNVRFLLRLIIENDDTGRVLLFDVNEKVLKPLESIVPTLVKPEDQYYENNTKKMKHYENYNHTDNELDKTIKSVSINGIGEGILDWRNLSFPNGVELTSNKSALMISDLNNRRIIMHHLKGLLKGQSVHLLWVPGYSDNIRRGLDNDKGEPTYWAACGCAVEDGYLELSEFFNNFPVIRRLLLKLLHIIGSIVEFLGNLFNSTCLLDSGFMIKSIWLKVDPYCAHGVVIQFNEQGKILRSLHAPHSRSKYKLLSEAHQVPIFLDEENANEDDESTPKTSNNSALYLGSVYYSYLGRVIL